MTAVTGTVIQAQADSTLDLAVADLNNDGRYDLVTVQGESGVFTNKFYRNVSGALDTRAPLVTAVLAPTAATGSDALRQRGYSGTTLAATLLRLGRAKQALLAP
mgnify:CR=1 FL=1